MYSLFTCQDYAKNKQIKRLLTLWGPVFLSCTLMVLSFITVASVADYHFVFIQHEFDSTGLVDYHLLNQLLWNFDCTYSSFHFYIAGPKRMFITDEKQKIIDEKYLEITDEYGYSTCGDGNILILPND